MFKSIVGLMTSATPDRVSTRSIAEYKETNEDYPVEQGLGALLLTQAKGLTIRNSTPVRAIDWSGKGVRVTTDKGTLTARAVVVAVPTSMLAREQIAFTPALPLSHREAVNALPLGNYEKVALLLSEPLSTEAENIMILPGDGNDPARPPLSCILSPFGRPLVMADIGGPFAGELARAGEVAMRAHVMEIVVDALGSDFSKKVIAHTVTNWTEQPFIEGAYSAALPGRHMDRTTLQAPIGERIFLAGEATSQREYASCHGAFRSGQAAADKVIAQLNGTAPV
jgi:monoamine oxidase